MNSQELTAILRASGEIGSSERVAAVETTREYTCTHRLSHLSLSVEDDLHRSRPVRLVLKRSAPGQTSGKPEVEFYKRVAPRTDPALVVRCHHAAFCDEARTFELLLEDLAPEWVSASSEVLKPPPPETRGVLFDTLRMFQVAWWDAADLQTPELRRGSCAEPVLRAWMHRRDTALNSTLPEWRSLVPAEVSVRYGELLASLPGWMASRLASARNQTLIHGDAHGGNFLVRNGETPAARLIDWPNWRPGLPTDDVAYLIAAWPAEEQQEALEKLVPEHFTTLVKAVGEAASSYKWQDWCADFLLSAGWTLVYAVGLLAEAPREWSLPVLTRSARLYARALETAAKSPASSA